MSTTHTESNSRITVTTTRNEFGTYVVVDGTHINPTRKFALIDDEIITGALDNDRIRTALAEAGYLDG